VLCNVLFSHLFFLVYSTNKLITFKSALYIHFIKNVKIVETVEIFILI